jgi:hypothetical protein
MPSRKSYSAADHLINATSTVALGTLDFSSNGQSQREPDYPVQNR